jgi:hypothetical protein
VWNDCNQCSILIAVWHADHEAGRTFSAIPRSNNQTSPRRGVVLFSVKKCKEVVRGVRGFLIVERARIERDRPPQELRGKYTLLVRSERLECFKKLGSLPAHVFSVSIRLADCNPMPLSLATKASIRNTPGLELGPKRSGEARICGEIHANRSGSAQLEFKV